MSTFNQTNTTNFVLEVSDAGLTQAFKLNVQSAPIPGVRIPISELPGGTQGLTRSQLPGSTTEFDPLTVRFLVDENFESWLQMYQWMLSVNNYSDRERSGWKAPDENFPQAVTVHVLNNNKDDIIFSIHFYGAWCSDLSEIEFSLIEDTDPAMVCTAIIPYKFFEVEKDGIIITGRKTMTEAISDKVSNAVALHPSLR